MAVLAAELFAGRPELAGGVDRGELEQLLADLAATAAAAWPGLPLTPEAYVRAVGRHLPAAEDPVEALARLHAEDLYLATACGAGYPAAFDALDGSVLGQAVRGLRRLGPGELMDEVRHALRERLLLPDAAGQRRISSYSGQGPLLFWVRTAASRVALNLQRRAQGGALVQSDDSLLGLAADPRDLELSLLREQHGAAFAEAFHAALQQLAPRERNVLRLFVLDGLSAAQIGLLYGVTRMSVTRWISQARAALLAGVRQGLSERLGLPVEELDSLIRALRSGLDVSWRQL